jgi:IS1 family transposase
MGQTGLENGGKAAQAAEAAGNNLWPDTAFSTEAELRGKRYTVGIEGNNCQLRHRIRRVFRKTCCFSKKLFNHWKAFSMAFFYINYGYI